MQPAHLVQPKHQPCFISNRQLQPKKLAAYKLRQCNPCGNPNINMCVSNTTRLHEGCEKTMQLEYGNRN